MTHWTAQFVSYELQSAGPILLWGWCRTWRSKGGLHKMTQDDPEANNRLVRWGQRVSRGRAELSDVMGMQSSLRESRINAVQTASKVLIWAFYLFALLWHAGIQLNQLLLIPGTTAVVIGWVGREIVCNMISGVVLHLTQPFAQGDWISLTDENIDGWVQDVGSFYTKVVQWDKRPIYVPNGKLMPSLSVLCHDPIHECDPILLRDIPKIPTIVQEMQAAAGEQAKEQMEIQAVREQLQSEMQILEKQKNGEAKRRYVKLSGSTQSFRAHAPN
eukprot:Skav209279  [mRNA]  locus=scaffold1552:359305:368836:+ [translate_table: standard]